MNQTVTLCNALFGTRHTKWEINASNAHQKVRDGYMRDFTLKQAFYGEIINTESENGRVIWFTSFNNQRYEVTDNNVIMIDGDMVGIFDQEQNHAYFEENYDPYIDVQDFDEIRRLLMFDDEVEVEEEQLPEQE